MGKHTPQVSLSKEGLHVRFQSKPTGYHIKGYPDLTLNRKWMNTQLTNLVESAVRIQAGEIKRWDKPEPGFAYADNGEIKYIDCTALISEFQLFFRDGVVRPLVRFWADYLAQSYIDHWLYGNYWAKQYRFKEGEQGWEHEYVEWKYD